MYYTTTRHASQSPYNLYFMLLNQTARLVHNIIPICRGKVQTFVKHVLSIAARTIFIGLELAQYTNPFTITTMAENHHWPRGYVVASYRRSNLINVHFVWINCNCRHILWYKYIILYFTRNLWKIYDLKMLITCLKIKILSGGSLIMSHLYVWYNSLILIN